MTKLFLHIGLHRTATTWLQQMIFPRLPQNQITYNPAGISSTISAAVLGETEAIFDARRLLELHLKESPRILISNEIMCGTLWNLYRDFTEKMMLLKSIVGEAHIIIVLRNQVDLIQSIYRHALHRGSKLTFNQYLGLTETRYGKGVDPLVLDFGEKIACLKNTFGDTNVSVLFYEEMLEDRARFLARMFQILGVEVTDLPEIPQRVNRSFSAAACIVTPFLARLIERDRLDFTTIIERKLPERAAFLRRWVNSDYDGVPIARIFITRPPHRSLEALFSRVCQKTWLWLNKPMSRWRRLVQRRFDRVLYWDWDLYNSKVRRLLQSHYAKLNRSLIAEFPKLPAAYLYDPLSPDHRESSLADNSFRSAMEGD